MGKCGKEYSLHGQQRLLSESVLSTVWQTMFYHYKTSAWKCVVRQKRSERKSEHSQMEHVESSVRNFN